MQKKENGAPFNSIAAKLALLNFIKVEGNNILTRRGYNRLFFLVSTHIESR